MMNPVSLEKTANNELLIRWSDDRADLIPFKDLRLGCQCAHCVDKRMKGEEEKPQPQGVLPILTAAEARPLNIESMTPVGNYGYNVQFSDGHSSGIYTFDLLRAIGDAVISRDA